MSYSFEISADTSNEKVQQVFDDIMETTQLPFVPNFFRAQAVLPEMLEANWDTTKSLYTEESLFPRSLKEMISFVVAQGRHCKYCSSFHLAVCKMLEIDSDTLDMLINNLENIKPARTREILRFCLKLSRELPSQEDYKNLEESGVSKEELVEATRIVSTAIKFSIIADGLNVEVDQPFEELVGGSLDGWK